ncbi:MAG: hypothetical protein PF795_10695, partial [Kiritimatiellae bacterium]|nr:hypothetical protein [Kiritimatiellia bacterium]
FEIRLLIRRTGLWLFVPGCMSLFTMLFCLGASNVPLLKAFALTAFLSFLVAGLLSRLRVKGELSGCNAMTSVALGWLLVAAMCGLPLYLSARWMPPDTEVARAYGSWINAFFEGMSGITSCGLTVSARPDQLPMAIQWWRSLSEWVGGVGVVMFMFLLLEPKTQAYAFFHAEARDWHLKDDLHKTIFRIWIIFCGLTLAAVLSLRLTGVSWWEAVNHGMTAISTGGFTIRKDSYQSVSAITQAVTMCFMLLGGVSFRTLHTAVYQRKWPWRDATQLRWYLGLLLLGGSGLWAATWASHMQERPLPVLFQWVSALGTCGLSAADLSTWAPPTLILLVIAMCVGGAAGSTTGGIKISRFVWMSKFMLRRIHEHIQNREIPDFYMFDGEQINADDARKRIQYAYVLSSFWLITLFSGWLVLLFVMPAREPVHVLFEAASALGSVGLSTGVTQAEMPATAKLCLMLLMWLGRLEFVSVLMLLMWPWRKQR